MRARIRVLAATLASSLIVFVPGCARYQRYDLEVLPDADAPRWVVLDRKTGETRIEAWTNQPDRYHGWGIVEMNDLDEDSQSD